MAGDVANFDENEEDEGDKEAEGGEESETGTSARSFFEARCGGELSGGTGFL